MITEINDSKTLAKHKSCNCEYEFHSRKCQSNKTWNNDKCWCECKNQKEHHVCENDYI